jgi:hypothetical protein
MRKMKIVVKMKIMMKIKIMMEMKIMMKMKIILFSLSCDGDFIFSPLNVKLRLEKLCSFKI